MDDRPKVDTSRHRRPPHRMGGPPGSLGESNMEKRTLENLTQSLLKRSLPCGRPPMNQPPKEKKLKMALEKVDPKNSTI